MDPTFPDQDSFAGEKEEYLITIQELINQLMEAEEKRREAIKAKLEAEERLRVAVPWGSAEELGFLAGRRFAEEDLHAQIKKAQQFEDLYYKEWKQKKLIQEELDTCRKELEEAKKLLSAELRR